MNQESQYGISKAKREKMSSIESMISEIEEDYHRILGRFKKGLTNEGYYRFDKVPETELQSLQRDAMKFQRKIEYSLDFVIKLVKDEYVARLEELGNSLLDKLIPPGQSIK
jgi:hypothetical protein